MIARGLATGEDSGEQPEGKKRRRRRRGWLDIKNRGVEGGFILGLALARLSTTETPNIGFTASRRDDRRGKRELE